MKCVGDEVKFTILQSLVAESKKSKYFLIAGNDIFILPLSLIHVLLHLIMIRG